MTAQHDGSTAETDEANRDWFDDLPKVELHIHLEGAIPLPTMWRLLTKYGGSGDTPTPAALAERFQYTDFDHFLRTWLWKNQFIRELDDFELIGESVAMHLRAQNVRYVEAFYSPPDFAPIGLSTAEITRAMRAGLDRIDGIHVNLIADLVRNYGPKRGAQTLAELAELKEFGVIGIGIGGAEAPYPPEMFKAVFERAREIGFHTTAHAGEAAGANSIWGAIRALAVERIGHGTRAHEDPALLDYLAAHQIPLEMCPISNVRTAVVKSLKQHPIRDYIDRGLLVTVNTDDPAMFQTSLAEEYRALCRVHGLDRSDISQLVENAVEACWLDSDEKASLRQRIRVQPN